MMKDKLTMIKDFTSVETKGDVTILLKEIRNVWLQIETNTSTYDAIDEANAMYYSYRQEEGESNAKHLRNFKSIVSAIEHLGGTMFSDEMLITLENEKDVKKGNVTKENEEYKNIVRNKMLGVACLKRANPRKYGRLMTSIRDQHSFKKDVYPKTLSEAYELLENHSSAKTGESKRQSWRRGERGRHGGGRGRTGRGRGSRIGGMQFAQQASCTPGTDGHTVAYIKCFKLTRWDITPTFVPTPWKGIKCT